MCVRGDIYYVNLNEGRGSEQSGTRPAVIIQNNTGNQNSPTVIIATVTSALKRYIPTHLRVQLKEPSIVLCEQIMTVDKTRLGEKVGKLTEEEMKQLNEKLKISLSL